jgi:NTP pyrophosphatase (non-canonical NTP hydrolase)
MNFDQYVPLAVRTAKPFPTIKQNLQHAAIGLCTETGEFASEVKRIDIYGREMTEEMRLHMLEELGDILWYAALAAHTIRGYSPSGELNHPGVGALYEGVMYLQAGSSSLAQATENGNLNDVGVAIRHILVTVQTLAVRLDSTFGALMHDNIAKLQKRFPDAYSDAAAEARADKGGADHRNS